MSLVHGQNISAAEIEYEISRWDATLFARLGNAIAWVSTWQSTPALPAFTERVNVADNGIDAQWTGAIELDDTSRPSLLRSGNNVFQYKKREVTDQTRSRIVSALADDLRGEAGAIEQSTGHPLSSYVFFTNVDLTIEQHNTLRAAILDGISGSHVSVNIVGAAELAAMLNQFAHLRSAFFATGAFRTWGESWDAHESATILPRAPLIGRDDLIATVQHWIRDPEVRVIVLSGTHMMGKSRVVLEATRARDADVVEALDRASLTVEQLRRLEVPGREIVVIVNDADAEQAEQLAGAALTRNGLKVIFCLPTSESAPAPSFGYDTRIRPMSLRGISEEHGRQLIRAIRTDLDFSLESWVLDNADGVPGVILAAARLGPELRRDGGNFIEQIATGFERQVNARVGPSPRQALGILSLMSHVGIERDPARELSVLCTAFGSEENAVLNAIEPLVAAGFLRRDGSYAEVIPPPLANRLAARTVRGRARAVRQCFFDLADAGRARFLRRLLLLQDEEAQQFWEDMLGTDGPFATLDGLIESSRMFRFAAAANGQRAAPVLLRILQGNGLEDRHRIEGDERRDLVYAIEEMLFRDSTSETALRSLILLAEAESETWSNNATGVAKEAFFPLHPQMPLGLPRRLSVLREMMGQSSGLSMLAVDFAAAALEPHTSMQVRTTSAATPLGHRPQMTWGEVFRYQESCIDLLMDAAFRDERPAVRQAAGSHLPRALMELVMRAQTEHALPHLRAIVDAVIVGDDDFSVSGLADAIMWGRRAIRDGDARTPEDEETRETIRVLEEMIEKIKNATFAVRLKLWTGGWLLDPDSTTAPRAAADVAIAGLAQEACQAPQLLTEELTLWLSLAAQQGGNFWFQVGLADTNGIFQQRARQLSSTDKSTREFISYLLGWAARDRAAAQQFFDHVVDVDVATPHAVLAGALEIDPPDRGTSRMVGLLTSNRIDSERAAGGLLLGSTWLRQVSDEGLLQVFRVIAGRDFSGGSEIPHVVFHRISDRPIAPGPLTDFCWEYLEAHQPNHAHLADFYSDHLAARLTKLDPDRAFALLQTTIIDEREGSRWNPLSSHQPTFWRELSNLDRARALATVLDASRTPGLARVSIMWHMPNLMDLRADRNLLRQYAARGEQEALTVVQSITGGRAGFWPLAFELVNLYPENKRLRRDLELRVEQMGQLIAGPYSEHYERCREDVDYALGLPDVTEPVRIWLVDFSTRLRRAADEQRRREADDRINRG
ncbi:hypothetical protein [Bradyrhizobium oligotrophicum]|uniref:hypothetical protein n=1 Tax=Bradyrhizobium oligotrophicum TaxID=44255 RepID=UPI003EBA7538